MSEEKIIHLGTMTRSVCESCGEQADVELVDGSTWCSLCDGAARRLGYDDDAS